KRFFGQLHPSGKGYIAQYFVSSDKGKLKLSFRVKGKGSVRLWVGSYINPPKGGGGYHHLVKTTKVKNIPLTDDWQTHFLETTKAGVPTERVAVRFFVNKDSVLDLDDVYVTPIPE
ncbi:MAG: hypothetical protein IKA79_06600, partial [Lentisphaeria bacterium]|nr:hypothetical protein [Lentisphaeria bacterium]